jgi:hypothetical protein
MLLQPVSLRLIRLLTVDRDQACSSSTSRPIRSASLAGRLASCFLRRGLLGTLTCGDNATGAVHIEIASNFPAVPLHSQHQLQLLNGNRPGGVGQATVLADDGEAVVERADGEALLQQPSRHAPPGLGILVEIFGRPLDASLCQVGREAFERVALGGAGVVGLLGVVGGEGITPAGVIGGQARPRQIIAEADLAISWESGAAVMMVKAVLSVMGASPHRSSVSPIKWFHVYRAVARAVFSSLFPIPALAEQLQVTQFTCSAISAQHHMIDSETCCRTTAHTGPMISLPEVTPRLWGNVSVSVLFALSPVVGLQVIGAVLGSQHFFVPFSPLSRKRSLLLAPLDVGTVRPADEIDKYSGQSAC